jgi:hypothetical protein
LALKPLQRACPLDGDGSADNRRQLARRHHLERLVFELEGERRPDQQLDGARFHHGTAVEDLLDGGAPGRLQCLGGILGFFCNRMDRHHAQGAVGMDDPFRLHEGVGRLVLHREPGKGAGALADNDAGIDLETVLGFPGMSALLALEFGDVQR